MTLQFFTHLHQKLPVHVFDCPNDFFFFLQESLKTKYEDEDVIAHVDELLEELSSLPDLGEH